MEYTTHGGNCCGYGHIHGFDYADIASFDAAIEEHRAVARGDNRILEAILTDRQLSPTADDSRITREVRDAGGWPVLLASRGFRLAAQWVNSNTNRRCYQFLKIENLLTDDPAYRPAFDWNGTVQAAALAHPVAPRPPAAPGELPVRVREVEEVPAADENEVPARLRRVTTEFYAHLQNGGRRGPFESVDAVREAYPRVRRIDRRDIMSNGSSNWLTVRE